MMRSSILLICTVLCACATTPAAPPRPEQVFNDAAFRQPSTPLDTNIFALSDAMRRFLEVDIGPQIRRKGRLEGLVDALQTRGQLKLEYDSALTRTAAEAFDARAGNCISLVIMTAALAKALDLPVYFQRVYSEDTWSRDRDILFRSAHVNMVLRPRLAERNLYSDDGMQITVDFIPQQELRGYRTRPVEEHTIIAMYMNNRAAESLARGQLDDAYWLAREAIARDSGFLDAYNTLGVVYHRHGNLADAERVYRRVLERKPDSASAIANLAAVLTTAGRPEAAQALLHKLQSLEPNPPFYYLDIADLALKRGDLKAAISLYNKELARDPTYHAAHFGLAAAYYRLGDLASAQEHLSTALENSTTRRDHALYAAKLDRLRSSWTH